MMEDFLNFAIDTVEHTMIVRTVIAYLVIIFLTLLSLKLLVSLIKQIINLFK